MEATTRETDTATEIAQVGDERYTDTGNAEALIAAYGHMIAYVRGWGWLAYDGRRWVKDAKHTVLQHAKATIQQMYWEAANAPDRRERDRLADHASRSLALSRLKAMVELAESDSRIRKDVEDFDKDAMLLNCQNGTLDLRTGELREHNPADLITHISGAEYLPDATAPEWEAFVLDIMGGDAEMVQYLQRAFGYTLTGLVSEKAFFFCYGPTGNNGKSTMLETFLPVMGTYGAATDWRTFLSTGGGGRSIATDLARLVGVRYAISSEPAKGATLRTDRLKQFTGGDTMTACNLYEPEFEFRPQLKYWLSANDEPDVPESSNAFWNRVRKLPFNQDFSDRMDKGLKDRMTGQERAGILAWAVRGCLDWQARGKLDEPTKVLFALQDYRDAQDPFLVFIKEQCEAVDGAWVSGKDLHHAYQNWCKDTFGEYDRHRDISATKFYEMARQHGYTVKRATGGQRVHGLYAKDGQGIDQGKPMTDADWAREEAEQAEWRAVDKRRKREQAKTDARLEAIRASGRAVTAADLLDPDI
jgi:putative DNA primase/helicase